MPSGDIHYKYYIRGYVYQLPLTLILSFWNLKFSLGNIAGYSFHRWCDNDWDIMGTNNAEGRMVNELPLIGHFLYGVSSTYGSIFRKYHRSFITHFPFVSTLIRLIFIFTFPLIIFDYCGVNLIGDGWHMFYIGFWVGLSQADGIHWYLDKTHGEG